MERDHIRLHFFGDMTPIAPELRALAHETDEITEHLPKDCFQANVCLNYGGRDEILRAARRGLPRTYGHAVGSETFRRIATYCKQIGVEYLTVYAFSTENWKRSETEVSTIMALLKKYLL